MNNAINQPKRMSISLDKNTEELLKILVNTQGITQKEAIEQSIKTEYFLYLERMNRSKVLIETSENQIRELIFR